MEYVSESLLALQCDLHCIYLATFIFFPLESLENIDRNTIIARHDSSVYPRMPFRIRWWTTIMVTSEATQNVNISYSISYCFRLVICS